MSFVQTAVTKHHEDEQFSSSIYATMEPYDPVMSFEDFIADDEDIVDQVCSPDFLISNWWLHILFSIIRCILCILDFY